MKFTQEHLARRERVMTWYAPARLGLFYHWGLYTGGGSTHANPEYRAPLTYADPAALEAAAPDPELVARNMVATARECGAKYITLTVLHSCDGYCVIYPTKLPGFILRTRLDYFGAFVRECAANGIKPLGYLPCPADLWDTDGGPWLAEGYRDNAAFAKLIEGLVDELYDLHGDSIAGYWLDGITPDLTGLPAHIHSRLPDAIVIVNNCTSLNIPGVDYGTTEFVREGVEPTYSRPTALRRIPDRFRISIPGRDFNEDIPTCNSWWHHGAEDAEMPDARPYIEDPRFLVKQMISSLGQRGQWNFAWGLGPCVDGTVPDCFRPAVEALGRFMEWGSEAIYSTTGGEDSQLIPGYFSAPWSPEGFCSVTRSLDDPDLHYVLVTDAPDCDKALFHSKGAVPKRVTDLRSGKELPFAMAAGIILENVDWRDVEEFGAKVFRIEF